MTIQNKNNIRNVKKTEVKTAKKRTISSTQWLRRHLNDPYVKLAKNEAYRSRAAYKLIQIEEKFKILAGAGVIVDIGCAPGGWLQVAGQMSKYAKIIGLDLQPVVGIPGVVILEGDVYDEALLAQMLEHVPDKIDVVLSDMAASSTGQRDLDHLKVMSLVEAALEFAKENLKVGGSFVAKLLRGGEEAAFSLMLRKLFAKVKLFKPDASYSDSSEIYIVCQGYLEKDKKK